LYATVARRIAVEAYAMAAAVLPVAIAASTTVSPDKPMGAHARPLHAGTPAN
jgi:hypothetical protein